MNKVNICFVANYHKTDFFVEVADRIKSVNENVGIYWITVNRKIEAGLSEKYGDAHVLRVGIDTKENPGYEFIRINDLVYGDRILKDYDGAFSYLRNIQRPIVSFLQRNSISLIFGELTWAHELLIFRIASSRKLCVAKYFNPHTIRIPNGYFAFFCDEFQSELSIRHEVCASYPEITVQKPNYLAQNDKNASVHFSFIGRAKRLYNYLSKKTYDIHDPTMFRSMWTQFLTRISTEFNREAWRFIDKKKVDYFKGVNFVSLFLHKQPEASIDVVGRYYENQLMNIVNIWRSLPSGWCLLVKEHSNAVGDRSVFFYNELRKYPGIFLVGAAEDSHKLIRNSKLVVSVSGTVCYESAILGVPSITFAPMFFNRLKLSNQVSLSDLKNKSLDDLVELPVLASDNSDFRDWLAWHSYPGEIGDRVSSPKTFSDDNLDIVSKSFLSFIENAVVDDI